MKKFLVVVDMQKDFVNGTLGSKEATAIVPAVVKKIGCFDGEIFVTLDTHTENYLNTSEGKKLPIPHCIKGSDGWALDRNVAAALAKKRFTAVEKNTFGSVDLPAIISKAAADDDFCVELVGLCTDICIVSNALLLKAAFPECEISVDASCCAGASPETHSAALATMKCCQIDVI